MRVTHRVTDGPRLAELEPGSGIVKVEGGGVMLTGSFGAHGSEVALVDSEETIEVTDDDLAVHDRIIAGRAKSRERMEAAGMPESELQRFFGPEPKVDDELHAAMKSDAKGHQRRQRKLS
jgi:hypothetical protein